MNVGMFDLGALEEYFPILIQVIPGEECEGHRCSHHHLCSVPPVKDSPEDEDSGEGEQGKEEREAHRSLQLFL